MMPGVSHREEVVTNDANGSKTKLINNFLGIFGSKNGDHRHTNGSRDEFQQDQPSIAKFNRFRSERLGNRNVSDMSALKLYYESLKNQNNKAYSQLAGESLPDAHDDTQMHDDGEDSNNSVMKFGVDDHANRGVKRPFKESRDSSLIAGPPSVQSRKMSIPMLRQQITKINPRERSNLINLKRKMKLDAYYKRKMNYLNYYNQNSRGSANNSMDLSLVSATNTSFLPHERATELSSTRKLLQNNKHVDKKQKVKPVSNTSGIFNGSFMYDLEEEEEKQEAENDAATRNAASKAVNIDLKDPQNRYGPKALAPGLANILGGQKKRPLAKRPSTDAATAQPTDSSSRPIAVPSSQKQKDVPVGPSAAFSFLNNDKASAASAYHPKVEEVFDGDANAGHVAQAAKPPASSGFSFGSASTKSTSDAADGTKSSIGGFSGTFNSEKETNSAPTFSFGGAATAQSSATTSALPEVSKSAAPAFDGSEKKVPQEPPKSGFSFGLPNGEKKSEASVAPQPSFTFGGSTNGNKEASKPSFSFDSTTKDGNENKDVPKPTFSFGAPKTATDGQGTAGSAPSLVFGSSSTISGKPVAEAKPAFSFGMGSMGAQTTKENSKPAPGAFSFTLGGADKDAAAKSAGSTTFNFATAKDEDDREVSAPKRRLGGISTTDDENRGKPSQTLGNVQATENGKIESPKPGAPGAFSFGSKAGGFNFGAAGSAVSSTPSVVSEVAPAKPAFSFTADAKNNTAVSSKDSTPAPTPTGFSFGAAAGAQKPTFSTASRTTTPSFGAAALQPAQPAAFQFNLGAPAAGASKPDPASVFGASPNPVGANGGGFNFSASRSATPNFNFTGNAGGGEAPNPALVFGGQQQLQQKSAPPSVFGGFATSQQHAAAPAAPAAQPGDMFGSAVSFGGNPEPGNIFGQQAAAQPQSASPANMFASGSPAPQGGTPLPSRRMARMRQPRGHR